MKFSICNETWQTGTFEAVCQAAARIGYTGIEIAPFTLAPLITDLSRSELETYRQQACDAGLEVVGLHWLLAKTTGFHLNSEDAAVRRRTADYLRELARACAVLGGKILVFGSPTARQRPSGASLEQALDFAAATLTQITQDLADLNVLLCLEPLSPKETDFLQTAAEAVTLMQQIDHPNVRLHLDVKAMSSEAEPIEAILRQYLPLTAHFHANDPNLRGPGTGEVDFRPIFATLLDMNYSGWVSVEVFDYHPDAETIARDSLTYMQQCLQAVRPG